MIRIRQDSPYSEIAAQSDQLGSYRYRPLISRLRSQGLGPTSRRTDKKLCAAAVQREVPKEIQEMPAMI